MKKLDEYCIDAEIAIDNIVEESYVIDGRFRTFILEDSKKCLEALNKIKEYVENEIWNIEFELEHIDTEESEE